MTVTDERDLVTALLGVPGVAAAAVEPHAGGPGTLRLQLATGADEVDVAGAVNRLLRSKFGLAVDADRVRVLEQSGGLARSTVAPQTPVAPVAPVEEPRTARTTNGSGAAHREPVSGPAPTAPPSGPVAVPAATAAAPAGAAEAAPGAPRLVIERVQLVSAHLGVTVSVTLRCGERSEVGESEGAATSGALHRSVAEATARAVEQMVDDQVRFAVEHVEIASTGQERTALVVLSLVTDRGTQRLSGASVVRDDARQAVIRAVLAAVNRRVGPMLREVAG